MKDIDFDELDRAVSSAIASNSVTTTSVVDSTTTDIHKLTRTPINSHFASALNLPVSPTAQFDLESKQSVASTEVAPKPAVESNISVNVPPRPVVPTLLSTSSVEESKLPTPNRSVNFAPRPVVSPAFDESARTSAKNIDSALATGPLPTIPIPVKASQPISPIVGRRSGGRFMDVVTPTSTMRTVLSAPDRVSRLGSDVDQFEPVSQIAISNEEMTPVTLQKPVTLPEAPIDSDRGDSEIELDGIIEPKSTTVAMPVPNEPAVEVEIVNDDEEDADIDKINEDIDRTLNQLPEVQESPFLSGAKVEKRPLNAFMAESLNSAAVGTIEDIDSKTPAVNVAVETTASVLGQNGNNGSASQINLDIPLPAELQGELLSIESGDVAQDSDPIANLDRSNDVIPDKLKPDAQSSSGFISTPVSVATPTPIQPQLVTPQQTPTQTQAIATSSVPNQPTSVSNVVSKSVLNTDGPTSIAQQYQEKPNTGDQNSGAIFDTDSYHKGIVKPVKKNSNLPWMIWIAALLVVGVGVGVAVYFFVLPLL